MVKTANQLNKCIRKLLLEGFLLSDKDKSDDDTATEKSENLARYSFTLPSFLIDEIEKLGKTLEMNRSQIVREALSNWIQDKTKIVESSGPGIGISSYIYNHHDSRVVSEIMDAQHDKDDIISSTTHVHLDHNNCFEMAILKGDLNTLKILNDKLRSIKGLAFFSDLLIPSL